MEFRFNSTRRSGESMCNRTAINSGMKYSTRSQHFPAHKTCMRTFTLETCIGASGAYKAGIPRRRHRLPREDTRKEIACVGRKIVSVLGESVLVSVSMSVSASWNASLSEHEVRMLSAGTARGRS